MTLAREYRRFLAWDDAGLIVLYSIGQAQVAPRLPATSWPARLASTSPREDTTFLIIESGRWTVLVGRNGVGIPIYQLGSVGCELQHIRLFAVAILHTCSE